MPVIGTVTFAPGHDDEYPFAVCNCPHVVYVAGWLLHRDDVDARSALRTRNVVGVHDDEYVSHRLIEAVITFLPRIADSGKFRNDRAFTLPPLYDPSFNSADAD